MRVQWRCPEFVNLAQDEIDDLGRQIGAVIAEQLFHAFVVEAALADHQRRCLVAAVAVVAIVDCRMAEARRRLPGEGAFGAAAALVVAKLKLPGLLRVVDPDDQIHGLRREPSATQFTGDLSYITDFSEHVCHLTLV